MPLPQPDPEGFSLLAKFIGAATAVIVPVWGARTWLEKRLSTKAERAEYERQRDHIASLYEKLDQHARADEAHFTDMMQTMHANHAELLREMGRKVDR